jgi:hypothetical protein
MKPKNKKLQLSRETLRLLRNAELGEVAGGSDLSCQSLCVSCNCATTSVRMCCATETA